MPDGDKNPFQRARREREKSKDELVASQENSVTVSDDGRNKGFAVPGLGPLSLLSGAWYNKVTVKSAKKAIDRAANTEIDLTAVKDGIHSHVEPHIPRAQAALAQGKEVLGETTVHVQSLVSSAMGKASVRMNEYKERRVNARTGDVVRAAEHADGDYENAVSTEEVERVEPIQSGEEASEVIHQAPSKLLSMVANEDDKELPFGGHTLPEDALLHLADGASIEEDRIAQIPAGVSLMSRPGGPLPISDDVRQFVAIYADGTVFVHRQRMDDTNVLEARQKAKHHLDAGVRLKESMPVEFSFLRAAYEHAASQSVSKGVDTTEVRKDLVGLLHQAKESGASDIHIRYRGDRCWAEFEVDGFLTASVAEHPPVKASSIFTSAFYFGDHGDHIERPNVPQYQSVTDPNKLPKGTVGLRFTFTPMAGDGRDLNIRLLNAHSGFAEGGLGSMGYLDSQLDDLRYIQQVGQKLFTISGETGSGKSTAADLWCVDTNEQNDNALNINSVDDPVENMMPNINYIQVRTGQENSSGDALKAASKVALRNAPHIVKIGECRFPEQAEVAFEAAITGKIILTTIHTPSILNIPSRYKGMGVPPSEAYDPDRHLAWLGQTLIPGLCQGCKIKLKDSSNEIHRVLQKRLKGLFDELHQEFPDVTHAVFPHKGFDKIYEHLHVRGSGCEKCYKPNSKVKGIHGRYLAAEVIAEPNQKLLSKLQRNLEQGRHYWLQPKKKEMVNGRLEDVGGMGGISLHLHGFQYLLLGLIGVEEFLRRIGSFETLVQDIRWRGGITDV